MRLSHAVLIWLALSGVDSANVWAAATINLNNYGPAASPVFDFSSPFPAPAGRTWVELVTPAGPVSPIDGSSPILPLVEDGFFYAGIGLVPGVPDNALADFKLLVWMDAPTFDTARMRGWISWSQTTGAWDPNAVPPSPPTGPDLEFFVIPEPTSLSLGLMGGVALLLRRFRRRARPLCRGSSSR